MSDSQGIDQYTFILDGTEHLGASFDDFADVLYLWRGECPAAAFSLTTNEGHLVRVDPESGEIVGFTIFGWDGELHRTGLIEVTVPSILRDDTREVQPVEPTTHNLALVGAGA